MSNVEDRERAAREQKFAEAAALTVKKLQLRETRRVGQAEFLGDMIGGFGALTSGRGKLMVAGAQLTIILCLGAMLVMVLAPVA